MNLDNDGLDGVLYAPERPKRRSSVPVKEPPSVQKTFSTPPSRLAKGRTLGAIPPIRPTTAKPSYRKEERVMPSRRPSVKTNDDEIISVSTNLGTTQKGQPPKIVSEPPVENRPIVHETVVEPATETPAGKQDRRPDQSGRRWGVAAATVIIGGVVVFSAAFFGGAFRKQHRRELTHATPFSITINAASSESQPPPTLENRAREIDPAPAEEKQHVAQEEEQQVAQTPAPIESESSEASEALRFPGQYVKGDINPQIARWHEVDRLFRVVHKCKGEIVIAGHTCDSGDEETNKYISMRRAKVISKFFIERGFDRERLIVKGMGASMPVSDSETEQGRIENRRVDIICR